MQSVSAMSCCDFLAVWCQAAWRSAQVRIAHRRSEAERRRAARNRAALRIQTRWRGHAARHGVHCRIGFLTCSFDMVKAGELAGSGTTSRGRLRPAVEPAADTCSACTQVMSCGSGVRKRGSGAMWQQPASRPPSADGGSVMPWQLPSRCAVQIQLCHRSDVTANTGRPAAGDERVILSHCRAKLDGPVATSRCMPFASDTSSEASYACQQAVRGPSSSSGDGSLSELLGALQALEPQPWALPVPRLPTPPDAALRLPASAMPPSARAGTHPSHAAPITPPSAAEAKQVPDGAASASGGSQRGRRHERWTAPDLAASPAGVDCQFCRSASKVQLLHLSTACPERLLTAVTVVDTSHGEGTCSYLLRICVISSLHVSSY